MDIVIFIIAMLVFYVLPEILKRRRKTEYKYPEIPERVPPPPAKVPPTVPDSGDKRLPPSAIPDLAQVNKPVAAKETPPAAILDPGQVPSAAAVQAALPHETTGWQNGLDTAAVINGIIYAEILQPPKALRRRRGLK